MVVEGEAQVPGGLVYLGTGRSELTLGGAPRGRVMVLGGVPLEEPLLMGWNFVVRDADELEDAFRSWSADDGRFGTVHGARSARIPSPRPRAR